MADLLDKLSPRDREVLMTGTPEEVKEHCAYLDLNYNSVRGALSRRRTADAIRNRDDYDIQIAQDRLALYKENPRSVSLDDVMIEAIGAEEWEAAKAQGKVECEEWKAAGKPEPPEGWDVFDLDEMGPRMLRNALLAERTLRLTGKPVSQDDLESPFDELTSEYGDVVERPIGDGLILRGEVVRVMKDKDFNELIEDLKEGKIARTSTYVDGVLVREIDYEAGTVVDFGTPLPDLPSEQIIQEAEVGVCPPALVVVKPPQELHLTKWLYAADFHAPLHSELWVERLCRVLYHEEIQDLVIGGDFFDFDSISNHPADLPQVDLNDSIRVAGQVLRYIKSHVKTVHILPGNHCLRLARRLNKHLAFENLIRMSVGDTTGFHVTDDDYFYITDPIGRWSVGHPRFFSAYPTKGLDAVATQRQRNVIGGHSHTLGLAKIGQYWCISPGMLMRPDLTPYLSRSAGMSKHSDQSSGFVVLDGTIRLMADGLTRWSDYR